METNQKTVTLEPYNDNWPSEYLKEYEQLNTLVGTYVLKIEHVGSTAIIGVSAKPIIDIAIAVSQLDDALKFSKILEDNGYIFRYDNGVKSEYFVRKNNGEVNTHFIHIVEEGSKRWNDMIMFRDYLNNHYYKMIEYKELKEALAVKYADDRKSYTAAKNDFILDILKLAQGE